jgi:hypothetical protein
LNLLGSSLKAPTYVQGVWCTSKMLPADPERQLLPVRVITADMPPHRWIIHYLQPNKRFPAIIDRRNVWTGGRQIGIGTMAEIMIRPCCGLDNHSHATKPDTWKAACLANVARVDCRAKALPQHLESHVRSARQARSLDRRCHLHHSLIVAIRSPNDLKPGCYLLHMLLDLLIG